MVYSQNGMLLIMRNELLIPTTCMNCQNLMLNKRRHTRRNMLHNSIHVKFKKRQMGLEIRIMVASVEEGYRELSQVMAMFSILTFVKIHQTITQDLFILLHVAVP